MRSLCVLLLLALAGGCGESGPPDVPAGAYRHLGDRMIVALGMANVFPPCMTRYEDYDAPSPVADCFKMSPARRMVGVWRDEFEGQAFFPGRTVPPSPGTEGEDEIWLDLDPALRPSPSASLKGEIPAPRWFRIGFIGRQTLYPGGYGHMGGSRHYVIVDRLLSLTPIEDSGQKP